MRISDWSSDVCSSDLIFAPSASDLVELEELADRFGVFLDLHLDVSETGAPFIWLGNIERTGGAVGAGRQALRLVAAYAADNGLAIRAAVQIRRASCRT